MSLFAWLSLLSAVVIILLGNFVYYRDPKHPLNKIFMVFCISSAYWSFTEFGYRQAGDYATARLWFKLGSFWPFGIAILLHFVLVFTGQWRRFGPRLAGVLLYGPALVFSMVDLTTDLISGEPIRMYWGWTYGFANSVMKDVSDLWTLSLAIMAVVLCGRFFIRATDPLNKQQAKYITLGLFFSVTAGVVSEIILPWLGIKLPELTTTAALVEAGLIGYAIWKYRLFIISAETAAESIIATMSDALVLLSPEGCIRQVNQATMRLLGYSEGELIGQPLAVFGAYKEQEDGVDFTQRWFAKLSQTGFINDFETSLKTKWGQDIPISLSGSIVRNKQGEPEGIVCVGRDLTERKQAEAALQKAKDELETRVLERTLELSQANERLEFELAARACAEERLTTYAARLECSNRELQDFAYVASHGLQEPLRKIQTFGDRLAARYGQLLDEPGRDYLERMQNAARRMQTLINDLLTYSRVTTRAQPFQAVDLGQVARGVVSDLEVLIEEVGGRVEVGELPTIEADPTQMRQLLQNLIGNALKFHRPDEPPVVKLCAARLNGRNGGRVGDAPSADVCQILVEDNGIGFDEKYLDRIFQVFQRLHSRGEYEGTGIGLATSRKIVERHGGEITAKSMPGQGSTFIVTLPLRQPQGEEPDEG